MSRATAPPARGLLKASLLPGQHHRWLPGDSLSAFVEHFWFVSWNLGEQPEQEVATLPHPSVHLVFEHGRIAEIAGVHTRRFVRQLNGCGHVFGIKFRPGGFHVFYKNDLLHLRNQRISIESVFGQRGMELSDAITNNVDNEQRMQLAEQFLCEHSPSVDHSLKQVAEIVTLMSHDKSITSINRISEQFGIGMRQLQRLFLRYVGVTPKWVLQRYRLHEALVQSHLTNKPDWSQLAMQLGYNDQAHFIKDFKRSVGMTPEQYWQS